jgi:zinc transport system permease protein
MTTDAVKKGISMIEFLRALVDPDTDFLRLAVLVGVLSSFSFGIIGTYIITRRISYIAGAISHCVFGGIGGALFLQNRMGITWFTPVLGAIISALLAAVIIGLVSLYAHQREDTVIGSIWAIGMASGMLFIDLTPGYFDITSYLFGDILLISSSDIWIVAGLDLTVVVLSCFFYNKLVAVCFDDEFARLRGINSSAIYLLLLCLIALTIVLLVRVVGIIMVIALLTIPSAIAGHFARRLWQMMTVAVILCMVFTSSGIAFSYLYNMSSGPVIIIVAGITYVLVISGSWVFKVKKKQIKCSDETPADK